MRFKLICLSSVSLLVSAVPAWAQDSEQPPEEATGDEIVVTAQR